MYAALRSPSSLETPAFCTRSEPVNRDALRAQPAPSASACGSAAAAAVVLAAATGGVLRDRADASALRAGARRGNVGTTLAFANAPRHPAGGDGAPADLRLYPDAAHAGYRGLNKALDSFPRA